MANLPPGVAETRVAVRRALLPVRATHGGGALVLVACSGGADSLALAAACAFVAPRAGLRAGLVTVDHGLQGGSAARAADVVTWARGQGMEPTEVVTVTVGTAGGPEAAARQARYTALDQAVARSGAAAVLLGHTRDDQAETVLLALARGAGPRGLAGMPAVRGHYRRPFLDLARATTRAACTSLGLQPWDDPHNSDPSFTRSRVRALLPELVRTLGPGVIPNLARTAHLIAADVEVLDELAAIAAAEATRDDGALDVAALAAQPAAIRTRVLHGYARQHGASGSALAARHVAAMDALITAWRGQGPVHLPGGITVARVAGRIAVTAPYK